MTRVFSARERRFGGYLEDYEVGDVFQHWPGRTITEAEDHMFCLLTMAASPLHVDRLSLPTLIDVFDGNDLLPGDRVTGPALIDGADTTIWIPSTATAQVDANRTLIAELA